MAYMIPQEKLITLTAGHIRAMMSSQGVDELDGDVEMHQEPGKMHLSDFPCIVFDGWYEDTYRCDELLNQLQLKRVNDSVSVVLTFVGGEARLAKLDKPDKIVARCQLS